MRIQVMMQMLEVEEYLFGVILLGLVSPNRLTQKPVDKVTTRLSTQTGLDIELFCI
jgi:hypothetical protein